MATFVSLIHCVKNVQNVTTMFQSSRLCTYCIFNLSEPLESACWTNPWDTCVAVTRTTKEPKRFDEYLHILLVKLIKPSLQLQTCYFILEDWVAAARRFNLRVGTDTWR